MSNQSKLLPREIEEGVIKLIEECGEVAQEGCKILIAGPAHVQRDKEVPNINLLEMEIGDFLARLDMLITLKFVSKANIEKRKFQKLEKIYKWNNRE